MPPRKANSDDGKAIWINLEVVVLLDVPVQAANPAANPKKDQLQKCLGQYLFIKKYSGVGWDDEENHAMVTAEFIETFIKVNSPKYTKFFKKPCPFYIKLNELFHGLVNKATGEHVVHLAPAMEEMSVAALGDDLEKENNVVEVDKWEGSSKGKGRAGFNDELSMSSCEKATRKRECVISDDNDDTPQARLVGMKFWRYSNVLKRNRGNGRKATEKDAAMDEWRNNPGRGLPEPMGKEQRRSSGVPE
ncbi:hypothetical protein B0H14DRAFT_2566993 [Mycena olivaceomarginata]|nr:hypothetical protein B0H14DRAFT_2566993 [Mycena olivaceomarginata]